MEAHVFEIAAGALATLWNPLALTLALLIALAFATGIAGRIAVTLEDLRHAGES